MMARKSEFAQKLLDDLRLRKERMGAGAGQSSSSSSNSMARADAHGQFRRRQRGSQEMVPHKTGTPRVTGGGGHRRSLTSSSSRSLVPENSLNQLVPFERGQSANQRCHTPVALDFAYETGEKIRLDAAMSRTMLSFLQQITQGSVIDIRNAKKENIKGTGSSNFQFSTLHIKEISKGAQNLNNILKACSNGLNVDRYSIEIGKELFRSAKDLEESLKMLVGLQEASDCMTTPHRNSRIRLLEGGEEDEDHKGSIKENHKQLDRPRFSFDKSKHAILHQETNKSLRQKTETRTYTYLTKTHTSTSGKNSSNTTSVVTHRPSPSNASEIDGTAAQRKESILNVSKAERKCLPNVIAQLMGLEDVPLHEEIENGPLKKPGSKQNDGTAITMAPWSATGSQLKIKDAEFPRTQMVKSRLVDKLLVIKGTASATHRERKQDNLHSENAVQTQKQLKKDPYNKETKRIASTERANSANKARMQEHSATQLRKHQVVQNERHEPGRKHDLVYMRNTHGPMDGAASIPQPGDRFQLLDSQRRQREKTRTILLAKEGHNENKFVIGKRNLKTQLAQNADKPQNGFGSSKRTLFGQPINISGRYQRDLKELTPEKNKWKVKGKSGIALAPDNSKREKLQLNHEIQQCESKESCSATSEISSPVTQNSHNHDEKIVPILTENITMDKNNAEVATSIKKLVNSDGQQSSSSKTMDHKMLHRKETPQNRDTLQDNQVSILKVTEVIQDEIRNFEGLAKEKAMGLREGDIHIVRSTGPKTGMHLLQTTIKPIQNQAEFSIGLQSADLQDKNQGLISGLGLHEKTQPCSFENGAKMKSCGIQPIPIHDSDKKRLDIYYPPKNVTHKTVEANQPEPLKEEEIQVKQQLVLDQLFLNTAVALFKLNIPDNILHVGDQETKDPEIKILIDSGCELMKRKARRQELVVDPFTKTSISLRKVESLDDLVKQLCKEFETLKLYGGNWGDDIGVCLLGMVEKDMCHHNPDINCMWDYGWKDTSFALAWKEDIVQEVEKCLLNDLIDEIL